jgi:hypothetical protein
MNEFWIKWVRIGHGGENREMGRSKERKRRQSNNKSTKNSKRQMDYDGHERRMH